MTPDKLGRYRILGELGRGAMGTVYRAMDPLIEREVAIKTLHPNLPEEVMAEVRERFVREAKSAGRLNHPSIVTIFDVGKQGDVIYIAMELLEGRSLQQMLRDAARLPLDAVVEIAAQIADALDHACRLGIVHRDVKPANVVVSASGRAKLTDFGVAYVPSSTMTQTGTALGSPRYMSPEQVLGLRVDPRSDIFSLGVVLYEMLARRTPFERAGETSIFPLLNRIAAEPHPPVTQLDPSIPAAFEDILRKALEKKPEERYLRAGEMARDLRNLTGIRAPAAPALEEKTLVISRGPEARHDGKAPSPAGQGPAAPAPADDSAKTRLLSDLDDFSRSFEEKEAERIRAEEEARLKKREELRLWAEAEARKAGEVQRHGPAAAPVARGGSGSPAGGGAAPAGDSAPMPGPRRAALEALKKQAKTHPGAAEKAAQKAEADARLDHSMRAASQYLAEFAREVNALHPTAGRPYDFFFLGRLPAVTIADVFTDFRSRKIDGKDHADHVFLRFRIQPTTPATANLLGKDISHFRHYLEALKIPFEASVEAKNDFGQAARATFTVTAPLPCELSIRADYDAPRITIELLNVRHPGRAKITLEPTALDDVVDDLARYVLGADDDLEKLLSRR